MSDLFYLIMLGILILILVDAVRFTDEIEHLSHFLKLFQDELPSTLPRSSSEHGGSSVSLIPGWSPADAVSTVNGASSISAWPSVSWNAVWRSSSTWLPTYGGWPGVSRHASAVPTSTLQRPRSSPAPYNTKDLYVCGQYIRRYG